jgi:hypothetical protein
VRLGLAAQSRRRDLCEQGGVRLPVGAIFQQVERGRSG